MAGSNSQSQPETGLGWSDLLNWQGLIPMLRDKAYASAGQKNPNDSGRTFTDDAVIIMGFLLVVVGLIISIMQTNVGKQIVTAAAVA